MTTKIKIEYVEGDTHLAHIKTTNDSFATILSLGESTERYIYAGEDITISEVLETKVRSEEEIEKIAHICHEANKAYCSTIGDNSHTPWNTLEDNIRQSAIDGVMFRLDNEDTSSEEMHDNWSTFKRNDGWIYGDKKDAEKKTHPCLVSYHNLPEAEKIKDRLFTSIVDSFR